MDRICFCTFVDINAILTDTIHYTYPNAVKNAVGYDIYIVQSFFIDIQ